MTPESIHSQLKAQAGLLWLKRILRLVFGLPLCLVAPLIMGTIFWIAGYSLGLSAGAGWTTFFWVSAAVFIPLLFVLEARTSGEYFSDTLRESEVSDTVGVTAIVGMLAGMPRLGAAVGVNPRASLAGFIEFFLIGPRMVLAVVNDLRASWRFGKVDLGRAARILAVLFRKSVGVHPSNVLSAGETLDDVAPAIAYLAYHQWVGVAANADKIWMPTDVRKKLA